MEKTTSQLLDDVVRNRFEPNEIVFRTKMSLLLHKIREEKELEFDARQTMMKEKS